MSIYASWLGIEDDDHADGCAKWRPAADSDPLVAIYPDGRRLTLDADTDCTCRCGPIAYQGSHVLPSDDDPRRGVVYVCAIPGFISRDGDDHGDDETVRPWLRLTVNKESVVLDLAQVEQVHDQLGEWLARVAS